MLRFAKFDAHIIHIILFHPLRQMISSAIQPATIVPIPIDIVEITVKATVGSYGYRMAMVLC